jgi:hypothetical protein
MPLCSLTVRAFHRSRFMQHESIVACGLKAFMRGQASASNLLNKCTNRGRNEEFELITQINPMPTP